MKYAEVVDCIARDYAVRQVRDAQKYAHCRGSNLSAEELVEYFNNAYDYMSERIKSTSVLTVGGYEVAGPALEK